MIASSVISARVSAFSVCSWDAVASTVTCSVTCPITSAMSTLATELAEIVTFASL